MLEKTLESLLNSKEIQPVHPKGNQFWTFFGRADSEAETPTLWPPDEKLTHWKRPWYWAWLKVEEDGDDRGWDGWMTSLTQCTWVWVISGSWQWTGRPGVLQSMGSPRVRHDWATEMNWTELAHQGQFSAVSSHPFLLDTWFFAPLLTCSFKTSRWIYLF